jgi:hypothetical protein
LEHTLRSCDECITNYARTYDGLPSITIAATDVAGDIDLYVKAEVAAKIIVAEFAQLVNLAFHPLEHTLRPCDECITNDTRQEIDIARTYDGLPSITIAATDVAGDIDLYVKAEVAAKALRTALSLRSLHSWSIWHFTHWNIPCAPAMSVSPYYGKWSLTIPKTLKWCSDC